MPYFPVSIFKAQEENFKLVIFTLVLSSLKMI